jgi:hypothetical protein
MIAIKDPRPHAAPVAKAMPHCGNFSRLLRKGDATLGQYLAPRHKAERAGTIAHARVDVDRVSLRRRR